MMTQTRWVTRGGLGVALACFFLPFVTVSSCSGNDQPQGKATYTGVDLLTNRKPDVTMTSDSPSGSLTGLVPNVAPYAALAVIAIVLTILATTQLGHWRPSMTVVAGAVISLALLVLTEVLATKHVGIGTPETLAADPDKSRGGGAAQIGFIVSALALVATALAVGVDAVTCRMQRRRTRRNAQLRE
jgi:hypothetical protein